MPSQPCILSIWVASAPLVDRAYWTVTVRQCTEMDIGVSTLWPGRNLAGLASPELPLLCKVVIAPLFCLQNSFALREAAPDAVRVELFGGGRRRGPAWLLVPRPVSTRPCYQQGTLFEKSNPQTRLLLLTLGGSPKHFWVWPACPPTKLPGGPRAKSLPTLSKTFPAAVPSGGSTFH